MSIRPEQSLAIENAAHELDGYPETRCQKAMAELYRRAGLLPADFAVPDGPRDAARWRGTSQIADFMAACPYFEEVAGPHEPGDLLGFRLGHTLHHVAVALAGGRLVHVFGLHGVRIAPAIPDEWAKRIEKVWRLRA